VAYFFLLITESTILLVKSVVIRRLIKKIRKSFVKCSSGARVSALDLGLGPHAPEFRARTLATPPSFALRGGGKRG
jgi:hypothetical protein